MSNRGTATGEGPCIKGWVTLREHRAIRERHCIAAGVCGVVNAVQCQSDMLSKLPWPSSMAAQSRGNVVLVAFQGMLKVQHSESLHS